MGAVRASIMRFVDAVTKSHFPVSSNDRVACPVQGCDGEVTSQIMLPSARGKKAMNRRLPVAFAGTCSTCTAGCSSAEVVALQISATLRQANIEESEVLAGLKASLDDHIRKAGPLDLWEDMEEGPEWSAEQRVALRAVIRTLLLQKAGQVHSPYHHRSCFKASVRNGGHSCICRYLFPYDAHPGASVLSGGDEGVAVQYRPMGAEYLNAFSDVLFDFTRSNHDLKVVTNDVAVMMYTLKYTTKAQFSMENDGTLLLQAVANRQARDAQRGDLGPATAAKRGAALCMSAARAMTGKQEVADTLACLYILRGSGVYSSHSFSRVMLTQTIAALVGDAYCAPFEETDGRQVCPLLFSFSFALLLYLLLPHSLNLSLSPGLCDTAYGLRLQTRRPQRRVLQ